MRGDSRTTQNARNKWMNSTFFSSNANGFHSCCSQYGVHNCLTSQERGKKRSLNCCLFYFNFCDLLNEQSDYFNKKMYIFLRPRNRMLDRKTLRFLLVFVYSFHFILVIVLTIIEEHEYNRQVRYNYFPFEDCILINLTIMRTVCCRFGKICTEHENGLTNIREAWETDGVDTQLKDIMTSLIIHDSSSVIELIL